MKTYFFCPAKIQLKMSYNQGNKCEILNIFAVFVVVLRLFLVFVFLLSGKQISRLFVKFD